jgi:hypothetical protein
LLGFRVSQTADRPSNNCVSHLGDYRVRFGQIPSRDFLELLGVTEISDEARLPLLSEHLLS